MNQDLLTDPSETRSNASPVDDKLPSQSLTKSERNEPPYHDHEDHPLPYTFSPEQVQPLYSSTRFMPRDYTDERHQRVYPSAEPTEYRHSDYYPTRGYLHSYEPYYDAQRYNESTPTHVSKRQSSTSHTYALHGEAIYSQPPMPQYNPTSSYYAPNPLLDNNHLTYGGRYALSHYPSTAHDDMTEHHASHSQRYLSDESGNDRSPAIKESEINPNDVLCGRGGLTNTHNGNRSFRAVVKEYQEKYVTAKKKEKPQVAELIVKKIRAMVPSGRFIKKDKSTGRWYDVGDEKAVEKTCQALREGASKIRSRMVSTTTSNEYAGNADADLEAQPCSDEDKKRSWEDFPPEMPPLQNPQLATDPLMAQFKVDEDYNLILPDPFVPSQLLSYDMSETVMSQSPIRMSERWDKYQSPSRRKRPKSDSDSPGLPLDGNFFAAPRSAQLDRRVKGDQERPQSKSV